MPREGVHRDSRRPWYPGISRKSPKARGNSGLSTKEMREGEHTVLYTSVASGGFSALLRELPGTQTFRYFLVLPDGVPTPGARMTGGHRPWWQGLGSGVCGGDDGQERHPHVLTLCTDPSPNLLCAEN